MHVNRAAESVLCERCQAVVALTPAVWTKLLGERIGGATQFAPGTGMGGRFMSGLVSANIAVGRLDVRCDGCKTPLVVPTLDGPTELACSGCDLKAQARPAPGWLRELHPNIAAVVGEDAGPTKAAPLAGQERGLMVWRNDQLEFSDEARLIASSAAKSIAVLDHGDEPGEGRVWMLEAGNGELLGAFCAQDARPGDDAPSSLRPYHGDRLTRPTDRHATPSYATRALLLRRGNAASPAKVEHE